MLTQFHARDASGQTGSKEGGDSKEGDGLGRTQHNRVTIGTDTQSRKDILLLFNEHQANKFINHHFMPHQTFPKFLHGSYTN